MVITLLIVGLITITSLWRRSAAETRRAEASKLLALRQLELEHYPTLSVAYALKSLEFYRLRYQTKCVIPTVLVVQGDRARTEYPFSYPFLILQLPQPERVDIWLRLT